MERLREAYNNNKKLFIIGAAAGTAALGLYGIRRLQIQKTTHKVVDTFFESQNLPLYATEAVTREKILSNVTYDLVLALSKTSDTYHGRLRTTFMVNNLATQTDLKDLFLDFHGKSVYEMEINGQKVVGENLQFSKHRVHIPKELLDPNSTNDVSFKFSNTYVNNSAGLHKYQDPKDNQVYLYTHLEPYFCHRWFPCFDQPSIRAPLKLTVISPDKNWHIIGNGKTQTIQPLKDQSSQKHLQALGILDILTDQDNDLSEIHYFEESPPISSYIYALFAGPFKVFENQNKGEKVPMRIFVRQSKEHLMDAPELFSVISSGIKYYEDFFDCKFPFSKYDQIFVPEFRISAMENVGAVSFTDNFLKPVEEITDSFKVLFAYVALHEISHMWFGDLVTMKWWADLWLKESFATYMGAQCMIETESLKHYKNPEQLFIGYTFLALSEDIRSTTHPIQVSVKHTTDAANVFDRICYEKGACFINQLSHFVGRDVLAEGTRIYFQKYKFQNTTLDDYINCLQQAIDKKGSQVDFKAWTDSWLTKAGVNEIEPTIESDRENNVYRINLRQGVPTHGDRVYREQKIDVAIYDAGINEHVFSVHVKAEEHTNAVHEEALDKHPAAVLVNANNKGYCRVVFDPVSLAFFLKNISKIESNTNRSYIWRTLPDQVRLLKMSPHQFLECVYEHLIFEDEQQTLPYIFQKVNYMIRNYILTDEKQKNRHRYFELLNQKLLDTDNASLKATIAQVMLDNISTDDQLELAIEWIQPEAVIQKNQVTHYQLNKANKYAVIRAIFKSSKYTQQEKTRFLDEEMKYDFSDRDILFKHTVEACIPETGHKEKLWKEYVKGKEFNQKAFEASSAYFYDTSNEKQCQHFGDKFFSDIEEVFHKHHRDYAQAFFHNLSPVFLGRENDLDKLIKILERAVKSDNTHFINLLKNEIELLEEIIQVKDKAGTFEV